MEAVTTPSQVSPREEIFPPGKEGDKQRKKLNKEMKAKAKESNSCHKYFYITFDLFEHEKKYYSKNLLSIYLCRIVD